MLHWIAVVFIGFITGLIARWLKPGDDRSGCIFTTAVGILGSVVATYVGQKMGWYQPNDKAGFMISVVGAMVLLAVYNLIFGHKK